MRLQASVYGLDQVQRNLEAMEKNAKNYTVGEAIKEASMTAKALAEANAPRDTGKMASTLTIGKLKTKRSRKWQLVLTGTREQLGIKQNEIGYYPASQEFGYTTRSRKSVSDIYRGLWNKGNRKLAKEMRRISGSQKHIAGRHFMRDAIQRMRAIFPQIMREHVEEMLRRGNVMAKRDKAHKEHIAQRALARSRE